MITIKGYSLNSLTVGCKYTRAFSVDSAGGVIVDYVLGECGADNSPIPEDFYDRIGHGSEGQMELSGERQSRTFIVTRDKMNIMEKCRRRGEDGPNVETVVKRARHLMPSALSFINNPKTMLIGFVWQFCQDEAAERERFRHPSAETITSKLTKFSLDEREHPAEASVRVSFRQKIMGSLINKGEDDYINSILTVADTDMDSIWATEEEDKRNAIQDKRRITTITVDIQRLLNPRRELTTKLMDQHWQFSQNLLETRVKEILKGVGFGNNDNNKRD